MFRQLGLIMQAFYKAFQVVLVVSLLVVVMNYGFAIVLTQMVGHSQAQWDMEDQQKIEEWFGTIPRSMWTLFTIMTLSDWELIPKTLIKVLPSFPVFAFFIMYILIASYTMLSLITGIICESLIASQQDYKHKKLASIEGKREVVVAELREDLNELLEDNIDNGGCGAEDLKQSVRGDQELKKKLLDIQISMNDKAIAGLVDKLSKDGEEVVTIENFVDQLCNQTGVATGKGLVEVKHIALKGQTSTKECMEKIASLEKKVDKLKGLETLPQQLKDIQAMLEKMTKK